MADATSKIVAEHALFDGHILGNLLGLAKTWLPSIIQGLIAAGKIAPLLDTHQLADDIAPNVAHALAATPPPTASGWASFFSTWLPVIEKIVLDLLQSQGKLLPPGTPPPVPAH